MFATEKKSATFFSFLRYILRRGLTILLTIVIGIYLTVVIANRTGIIDNKVRQTSVTPFIPDKMAHLAEAALAEQNGIGSIEDFRAQAQLELEKEAGLTLPPALRNLQWTLKSFLFDWGLADYRGTPGTFNKYRDHLTVNEILLDHFPNTLLLVGVANLLIFVVGIPFSLHVATHQNNQWLDRIVQALSPLSSIPSWVHGIFLVALFAVQLKILPHGGKYDNLPPETQWGYINVIFKHMILPVLAILMGVFFQLVHTWRTYFLIYSEEDYVELARAKGLPPRLFQNRYILRPTFPYLLTSFTLTLVGFWQMTTALEYFFNWPGMGLLYVNSLPNFWGEVYFAGEMGVVLNIVVIFAFLLGGIVLALDLVYAWLDPRVRISNNDTILKQAKRKSTGRSLFPWAQKKSQTRAVHTLNVRSSAPRTGFNLSGWPIVMKQLWANLQVVFREILRYPSAVIGLTIIAIFALGSLLTVIFLPYQQIGTEWTRSSLTSRIYSPKNVPPRWLNWFRKSDFPETLILSSKDGTIDKTTRLLSDGTDEFTFTASFEYSNDEFPQDLRLYVDSTFVEKRPYISITWITPDGRTFEPRSPALDTSTIYSFSENLTLRKYTRTNKFWDQWVVVDGINPTPGFYLLLANPNLDFPQALQGTYQLNIIGNTFEENGDIDIEMVLLGQVYGWAGTDHLRRDLLVPLLWGLPFTLAFGVLGAVVTTTLAMFFAATGVWFGGWVDNLIQRLTEANMVLPVLAVGILFAGIYGIDLWTIIAIIILLNIFSSPNKAFRAAFIQIKEAPYIEAARAYGSSDRRIIFRYMIPRIIPVLIPQLITLIPSLVFLEATLAIFNVFDPRYPTWGRVIFEAIGQGALWGGSPYWVLQPISLLLLTGLAFSLLGSALERILNPRLQHL